MALVLAGQLGAGCALTSKSKSLVVRYFEPVRPERKPAAPIVAGPAPAEATPALQVRLGRVDAASYLREKMAFRDSSQEVGYYESLRWTEEPAAYLRRAMARALFEEHGLEEVVSGVAPTLELELVAFEEVRAPRHVARIELTWKLRAGRSVLRQRTVVVERPIAGGASGARGAEGASALATAMGAALDEAVQSVVGDVVVELGRAGQAGSATSPP